MRFLRAGNAVTVEHLFYGEIQWFLLNTSTKIQRKLLIVSEYSL